MREKFRGLDRRRWWGLPPFARARRRTLIISELTHLIERMGPVNLDAARAAREEKTAHLHGAEGRPGEGADDLRQAIAQMNRTSKRLFRETFDAVSKVQAAFPGCSRAAPSCISRFPTTS